MYGSLSFLQDVKIVQSLYLDDVCAVPTSAESSTFPSTFGPLSRLHSSDVVPAVDFRLSCSVYHLQVGRRLVKVTDTAAFSLKHAHRHVPLPGYNRGGQPSVSWARFRAGASPSHRRCVCAVDAVRQAIFALEGDEGCAERRLSRT